MEVAKSKNTKWTKKRKHSYDKCADTHKKIIHGGESILTKIKKYRGNIKNNAKNIK